MLAPSMLTRQISGGKGRGVSGARKLIPMPLRILRAPGRPTLICVRQSTIGRIVVLLFPGGRGVCGARKLIPMPAQTSCAPALPTPQASGLKPQVARNPPWRALLIAHFIGQPTALDIC